MPHIDTTTYFLLDSHQGLGPMKGWRVEESQNLQITSEGLRLASAASPPEPLQDAEGTFGGLENPTGVAVDAHGMIYVSDSNKHRLFKIVRREGLRPPRVHFFLLDNGAFAPDRFVYVPTAHRLERWPATLRRDPRDFSEVEVICETVWHETQARRLLLASLKEKAEATVEREECCGKRRLKPKKSDEIPEAKIAKEWDGEYPAQLPAGEICKTSIQYLPCLGGLGSAPRQFNQPRGLAISPSGNLYVADSKNHRIQVFALRGLMLKAIWGKRAGAAEVYEPYPETECSPLEEQIIRLGQPIAGNGLGEFDEPWDVVADLKGNVYVADKGNHRVQKYDCRTREFSVINGTILSAHFFKVLYGSSANDRFVFIPARRRLERWSRTLGRDPGNIGEVQILNENVSTTSAARQLALEAIDATGASDIFVEWEAAYPEALAAHPQPEPPFASPAHLAIDAAGRLFVVDEAKDYVKILNSAGRVLGQVTNVSDMVGSFRPTAIAIDHEGRILLANNTGIHRFHLDGECCVHDRRVASWRGRCTGIAGAADDHLFVVGNGPGAVAEIPSPQSFVKRGVYFSQSIDSDIDRCQWHKILLDFAAIPTGTSMRVWTHTSEIEHTLAEISDEDWQTGQINAKNFLILSPPGRFLRLKIELNGNSADTPVLLHLKVFFPRLTYLQYLPAVYQGDPVSKDFLERFLSIFEVFLGGMESKIDQFSQYFDPEGVPEKFLEWLGKWVDMIFDPSWPVATRRRLLRHAAELYRKRGTPAGLKRFLWLALGVEAQILEHFCLRRWLLLTSQTTLGNNSQLWDNCIVSRLQLSEAPLKEETNSRIGDFALVGTGDPERDPFHVYAHKFSVFVPAAFSHSDLTERMLRHLIQTEKPAHTQFTLHKVEARFRVGVQAVVGFDTLVGAYPRIVLNHCATLGYDTLLGCAPEDKGPAAIKVGERSRVGVTTAVG